MSNDRKSKEILIAAHRGTSGGNVLQNTTLAYQNALLHQAQIVEVDVTMSKDGVFYAFHDGQEAHVFGKDIDIRTMDSNEIEQLVMINEINEPVKQKIERFDTVFANMKDKCIMNIDRSWHYWETFLPYLKEKGDLSCLILKSPVITERLELLNESGLTINYMPIIRTIEDYQLALTYSNITIGAVELIFTTPDAEIIQPEFIQTIHQTNQKVWINSLRLNDRFDLAAGFDDNRAISGDFAGSWGKLVEIGVDIIQTDWPLLLHMYLAGK